jgi:hypothetical protein
MCASSGTNTAQDCGGLQICSFLTAYQILSDGNRLAVLASCDESVPCICSDLNVLVESDAPRATSSAAVQVAYGLNRILGAPISSLAMHVMRVQVSSWGVA